VASPSNRQSVRAPGDCQTPCYLQWATILQVYFRPCRARASAFLGWLRGKYVPQAFLILKPGFARVPARVHASLHLCWVGVIEQLAGGANPSTARTRRPGFEAVSQRKVSTWICHCETSVVLLYGPDIHLASRTSYPNLKKRGTDAEREFRLLKGHARVSRLGIEPKTPGWLVQAQPPAHRGCRASVKHTERARGLSLLHNTMVRGRFWDSAWRG
jgi:hypothetical protein